MQAQDTRFDRHLVARLVRRAARPGVIDGALARRILAGVAAMTERLPLLARFGGRRTVAATTPLVHARWAAPAPGEIPGADPGTRPVVHATPSRTVDRSSGPIVTREPLARATALPSVPDDAAERSGEPAASSTAPGQVVVAMSEPPLAASPIGVRELARGADPVTRRSRVGAPLHARPQILPPTDGPVSGPVRLLGAGVTPRSITAVRPVMIAATAVRTARPVVAATILRATPRRLPGRSVASSVASLVAWSVASSVAGPRGSLVEHVATPVVAATTAPAAPRPVPAIRPVISSSPRPAMPLVERLAVPAVPARSGDGERAHASELRNAHPLRAAEPAAIAALPGTPVRHPGASHRPIADAAAPLAPPQKVDLHGLAEQVQRILVRQAAHDRARQGLPR